MPCVGLVVLAGCLTFIVAPDEGPSTEARIQSALNALPTVVLDPGHGGKDDGATANGLVEKNLSLDVAERVEKILKPFNFPVILTRRDDTFIPLEERANIANRLENAVFVSIHFNHAKDRVSTGVETFYAPAKVLPNDPLTWVGFFNKPEQPPLDNGETLAGFIQASLVLRTDAVNRGIKSRELYVVRHTRCPAVLVEGGFINNPLEATLISNGEYRQRLASAIAEGIMSYQKTRPQPVAPTKLAKAGN
ncbi:MAG TPA: N-acetylmuramoyl-L-alanine amidase [Chthoniobacter sp.]|nr:N-acetylmuramoyl-L-alanine amidase [Chthoniobacter sp.]